MSTVLPGLIAVARGQAPADLILTGASIVNVFTGELEQGNVAIYKGLIAGIGDYRHGRKTIDLSGKVLAPGFINGHTHIESSMLDIGQFARAVVPHGTTSVVTDLHEIANVAGLDGLRYIMRATSRLPLDVFLMAPSCVPATHMETSGYTLDAAKIKRLLSWPGVIGLGEMMNYPGVLAGDKTVLAKIALAMDSVVDGHAPGLSGNDLSAYIAAGIGSDHESVTLLEAKQKLERGMYIMLREGSSEKNLADLLPLVTDKTYGRCFFVTDDRTPADLLSDGDIDAIIRKAVRLGLEPVRAVQLATINTASYFHLKGLGAIAPGYHANLVVLDDLSDLRVEMVFQDGKLVAGDGKATFKLPRRSAGRLTQTMNVKPFCLEAVEITTTAKTMPVVQIVPGQIVTKRTDMAVKTSQGRVQTDTGKDILKLVVVERHHATGNIGRGLVNGFGLRSGALASSIAHDSHNIIAVGVADRDIFAAVKEVERLGGGLAVVEDEKVLGSLALPIAGLLSDQPVETVASNLKDLEIKATKLGCKLASPFATLSFLALPVIPKLRLTDKGLVDVINFKIIG